jgi:hypothetical protein
MADANSQADANFQALSSNLAVLQNELQMLLDAAKRLRVECDEQAGSAAQRFAEAETQSARA